MFHWYPWPSRRMVQHLNLCTKICAMIGSLFSRQPKVIRMHYNLLRGRCEEIASLCSRLQDA